jgi:hypothetical protein
MKQYYFLESTRKWANYGYGTMLICITENPKRCEYVLFQKHKSFKKIVFNEELLNLYRSGK